MHIDARHALTHARVTAPAVIAWDSHGWIVYSPVSGVPNSRAQPEILVLSATLLIPLSDIGGEVLKSALKMPPIPLFQLSAVVLKEIFGAK